jgi:DNA-binding beta-propeller fold protein YncE
LALLLVATLSLTALWSSSALADSTVCNTGTGAGQCNGQRNIAVDRAAKRLYVADEKNNRIDVFDTETRAFVKAFGFGVKTGAAAFQVCESSCRAGVANGEAKPGEIEVPIGIAVDEDPASPSFHDVYVSELGGSLASGSGFHPRVQKLNPLAGAEEKGVEFVYALGKGVDKTSSGDICTAASGHTCGAAANSEAEGGFFTINEESFFVGVGSDGSLYVVDTLRPDQQSASRWRLQRFEGPGAQIVPQHVFFETSQGPAAGIAAVPSGNFWVIGAGFLQEYDTGGNQLKSISQTNPSPSGITTDASGDVFVVRSEGKEANITEFDSAGVPQRRFGYGRVETTPWGLAPDPSGESIFASEAQLSESENGKILAVDLPQNGPGGGMRPLVFPEACGASPLGNSSGTLRAQINPEGEPTTYHFELVSAEEFEATGFEHPTRVPALASEDPTLSGSPSQALPLFELEKASIETSALVPETGYRCRVVAENAEGKSTGPEGSFTSLPPLEIDSTFASSVEEEAATLNMEVDPLGISTSAYFQYVDAATYEKDIEELGSGHGFDHATKVPDEPIELGAGEEPSAASTKVSGLTPGTEYRYRVVATDIRINPREILGPTAAVRTRSSAEGILPDDRAYELVSPSQKAGADVAVPGHAGGLFAEENILRINASSGSSSSPKVTYTSWTSFGAAASSPSANQYISERTPDGWETANVSPFGFLVNALKPPYRGFSPDLERSAFVVDQPALTSEAQEGFQNLYLRDTQSGQIQALTVEEPQFKPSNNSSEDFCAGYGGASNDGSRAFFAANGAMAGAPEGTGFSLYEWSKESGLSLLSVLPNEEAAKPAEKSGFGAGSGLCSIDQRIIANAVSADGRTVFWTYGGKYSGANRPLFARLDGAETLELDQKQASAKGPSGEGTYWAATADGQKAFFSAPGKLTTSSEAAGQIYRFEPSASTGERLTDLTPGPVAPEVQGVIGASQDGSDLYFVAKGALTGEDEGPTGEKAETGANNLYLWHEGEGLRFIARLSGEEDSYDWEPIPQNLTARVSADGDLAFLSSAAEELSGYENHIFPGSACEPGLENSYIGDPYCPEAYLYDATANTLACASCNPTGQRPEGPAEVPNWSNPFEGPRYLSADGTRLFFESRDSLVGADENHQRDVYEYEQSGAGTCTSQSPTYAKASNGCLYLISSGRSEDDSYLIDASEEGEDVYFSTRQALVGWDENPDYDVYDAREGGGFAEPPLIRPICEGDACKPAPALPPPPGASPGTATFQGQPNQKGKPHGKKSHKHKRHVKQKKHKAKQKKGRSGR